MSAATPCIASLRVLRDGLRRDQNTTGAYWVNRCITLLQRQFGDASDALTTFEIDSARMPLDPPIQREGYP